MRSLRNGLAVGKLQSQLSEKGLVCQLWRVTRVLEHTGTALARAVGESQGDSVIVLLDRVFSEPGSQVDHPFGLDQVRLEGIDVL